MLTDLVQIRRLGEKDRAENLKFRKYLKSHNFVERQFLRTAKEIEAQIDCQQCAECCRVAKTPLVERDVQHIAKFLRISEKAFFEQYTTEDPEEGVVLRQTPSGCVFLSGNDCTIYESRPGNCERFPHLLRGNGSLLSRMWQFVDRATYCPIVYNWMEQVKTLTKFRPRA